MTDFIPVYVKLAGQNSGPKHGYHYKLNLQLTLLNEDHQQLLILVAIFRSWINLHDSKSGS